MRAMSIEIRDVADDELPALLAMNEASVPEVGSISLVRMKDFYDHAPYFRVALADDSVAAFLVGLTPDAAYESPNFRWFCRKYESFAYIDRIAVSDRSRRRGLGSALYRDFESCFTGRVPRLACEVNLRPPNEPSMAFHRRHGFVQVGSQQLDAEDKEVAMLVKELE